MTILMATRLPTEKQAVTPVSPTTKQTLADPAGDERLWRISVDHYHQMIKSGILTDDDPIELLEGKEVGHILVSDILPPPIANKDEG